MNYSGSSRSGGSNSRRRLSTTSGEEDGYPHIATPWPGRATAAQDYTSIPCTSQGHYTTGGKLPQNMYIQRLEKRLERIDEIVKDRIGNASQLHGWHSSSLENLAQQLVTPVEGNPFTPTKEDVRIYFTQNAKIDSKSVDRILREVKILRKTGPNLEPRQNLDFAADNETTHLDENYDLPSNSGKEHYKGATKEETIYEDEEPGEQEQEEEDQEEPDLDLTLGGPYAKHSHTTSGGQGSSQAGPAFDTNSWQQLPSSVPYYGNYENPSQMYDYLRQNVNPAQYYDPNQQYFSPNHQYQQQVSPQQQQIDRRFEREEGRHRRRSRHSGERAGGSQDAHNYGGGYSRNHYR